MKPLQWQYLQYLVIICTVFYIQYVPLVLQVKYFFKGSPYLSDESILLYDARIIFEGRNMVHASTITMGVY